MNRLIKFQTIAIILLNCIFVSCKEETEVTGECKIQSFIVTVDGQQIESQINEDEATITIPGVVGATSITAVSYQLSEGSTIYPTPESRIGDWRKDETFKVSLSSSVFRTYSVVLPDYIASEDEQKDYTGWETGQVATIKVNEKYGVVTDKFFYDIKDEGASVSNDVLMEMFYKTDMNGIRIPLYGDMKDGEYLGQKGVEVSDIITEDYDRTVNAVLYAKSLKPDITVFASKKSGNTWPDWLKDSNGIKVDNYVKMWISYLVYLKRNRIDVDVIGIDNENHAGLTTEKYKQIVNGIKTGIENENSSNGTGLKQPKFICPDYWTPKGDDNSSILFGLLKKNSPSDPNAETIDIYGTHYYPEHHAWGAYYSKLKYELEDIIHQFNENHADKTIEFWATEPHWDNHDTAKEDLMGYARMAMCCLWDQTDFGMHAFMWWGYPSSATELRSALMRDLSSVVYKSQPIRMEDHDGTELLKNEVQYNPVRFDNNNKYNKVNNYPTFNERVHSRAFIRGNEVNVYVINVRYKKEIEDFGKTQKIGSSYHDYKFNIEGSEIDGDVSYVQWTDESSFEGDKGKAKLSEDMKSFTMDLPLRSITRFTFKIKGN